MQEFGGILAEPIGFFHKITLSCHVVNIMNIAGKQMPLGAGYIVIQSILLQPGHAVYFRGNAVGQKKYILILLEMFADLPHIDKHSGANAFAGRKKEIGKIDFAGQVFATEGLPVLVYKMETANTMIFCAGRSLP